MITQTKPELVSVNSSGEFYKHSDLKEHDRLWRMWSTQTKFYREIGKFYQFAGSESNWILQGTDAAGLKRGHANNLMQTEADFWNL